MNTLRIAWLFAWKGAVADRSGFVLPVIAFAVSTLLLLIVAGGAQKFFRWTDIAALEYQLLAVIGLVLLVVPLTALGGSAARLSTRRRDDRLSGLRLLGATPATVAALTVIESTSLALAGAVLGAVCYLPVSQLIGLIPFRGEPLGSDALLVPGGILVAVLGVAALAAVSAAVGLRGVIVSPLGVRTRQKAPRTHWLRAVIAVVVVIAAFVVMGIVRQLEGAAAVVVIGAAIGITIGVLNLIGPWLLRLFAAVQARTARRPRTLLAARAVLESPKAAWRQVSGVSMTSFVAVFAGVAVVVSDSMGGSSAPGDFLMTDIRTGIVIVVIGSFLMVACSAGVNQAAAVLDRRDLYVSLDRMGMAMADMDAARSRAILSPLTITTVGSALAAAIIVLPLAGMAIIAAPLSLLMIAGCLAGGVLLVWTAVRATRPVLRHVLAEPMPSL